MLVVMFVYSKKGRGTTATFFSLVIAFLGIDVIGVSGVTSLAFRDPPNLVPSELESPTVTLSVRQP